MEDPDSDPILLKGNEVNKIETILIYDLTTTGVKYSHVMYLVLLFTYQYVEI